MKIIVSFALLMSCVTIAITGCAVKWTSEDIQQLEYVKGRFESQMKDDMHPVIWAYLDEVLHDPYSFRLQRFEYKKITYTFRGDFYKRDLHVPAYRVLMLYRVRIPAGGYMLKEMEFYLFKDKRILLPNGILFQLR